MISYLKLRQGRGHLLSTLLRLHLLHLTALILALSQTEVAEGGKEKGKVVTVRNLVGEVAVIRLILVLIVVAQTTPASDAHSAIGLPASTVVLPTSMNSVLEVLVVRCVTLYPTWRRHCWKSRRQTTGPIINEGNHRHMPTRLKGVTYNQYTSDSVSLQQEYEAFLSRKRASESSSSDQLAKTPRLMAPSTYSTTNFSPNTAPFGVVQPSISQQPICLHMLRAPPPQSSLNLTISSVD